MFSFTDYRPALRALADSLKEKDPGFSHAKFAEVIRAQKTFMSKVFSEEAHLSEDHMYLVYEKIPLSDLERCYLKLIYDYTRSGLQERKDKLLQEIHEIQDQWRRSGAHLKAEFTSPRPSVTEDANLISYYLEPWAPLIHMYLTLEQYQIQPSLLITKLGMSGEEHLNSVLQILKSCGFIDTKDSKTVATVSHIHLDSKSPFLRSHQTLARMHSGEHLLRLPVDRRFVFAVTFSANAETQSKIRQAFLAFSKEVEVLVRDSDPKDVYQLNFELFPWSVR